MTDAEVVATFERLCPGGWQAPQFEACGWCDRPFLHWWDVLAPQVPVVDVAAFCSVECRNAESKADAWTAA